MIIIIKILLCYAQKLCKGANNKLSNGLAVGGTGSLYGHVADQSHSLSAVHKHTVKLV